MVVTTREEMSEILGVALRAGQLMLENGANTARVEETVERFALALGVEGCDAYVTPTGILATVTIGTEHRTRIQRISRSGIDLSRVASVVDISRQTWRKELDRTTAKAALDRVATQPRAYNLPLTMLCVGVACASSAVLFGGGPWEYLVAFIAAALAYLVRDWLVRHQVSRAFLTAIVATLGSALALVLSNALRTPYPAQAISASVLFLVPGVLMVSSIADLFRGDTISGTARAVSAILTLVAIAGGLWVTLLVSRVQIDLTPRALDTLPLAMVLAFCSAGGFGVMFDVPPRALVFSALVGAIAAGVYRAGLMLDFPAGAAAFLGGATISLLAEILSRFLRIPTSIFAIPGFLPLVPGAAAFRTLLIFVADDYTAGTASLVRTIIVVVALAAGIGTVNAMARLGRPVHLV